jgi:hypothetical protein
MNGVIGLQCKIFKDNNLEQLEIEINNFIFDKKIYQVNLSADSYGITVVAIWFID